MTPRGKAWALFLPWAALATAATAWFVSQQTGSNLNFADCHHGGALAGLLIGILALALAATGALLSYRVWRRDAPEKEARIFIALVGLMASALLALAIILQTLGALIVPGCFG